LNSTILENTMYYLIRNRHSLLLGICGILAPLLLIISVIAGALVTADYNYMAESICQMSSQNSTHPGFLITGFVIYGFSMFGVAYELSRRLRPYKYAGIVRIFFVLHGTGFILTGLLRADPTLFDTMNTPMGILHNISATTGCLAMVFAMFTFTSITFYRRLWRGFAKVSFAVLSLVLAMLFFSLFSVASQIGGLLQRIYSILPLLWLMVVSIRCILQPGSLSDRKSNTLINT